MWGKFLTNFRNEILYSVAYSIMCGTKADLLYVKQKVLRKLQGSYQGQGGADLNNSNSDKRLKHFSKVRTQQLDVWVSQRQHRANHDKFW